MDSGLRQSNEIGRRIDDGKARALGLGRPRSIGHLCEDLKNRLRMKIAWLTSAWLLPTMFLIAACGGGEPTPTIAHAVEWGYQGPGAPENWASLSDDYALCADGERQSPIDIARYETGDAEAISFSYGGDAKAVRNKGKFVYVDYAPGSAFNVGERTFELKSAHLHSPSEHLVDGVSFAAELHLVHQDAGGALAVVGLLFRLGEPSPVVQAILDAAPDAGDAAAPTNDLNSGVYTPGELAYYKYDGSLTTPPCSEPVGWYVMREPKSISQEQVDSLLALSGGPNNRPVQPTGNRKIIAGGAP